ncbi:MAG: DUF1330 domain-containing protein [Rhodospirillaceae bacterium]|nr:DUF1330 domain-containing protein [Rhodospirillaceae bacterium]MXW93726.1 DUF1330 domain-containing protein [Rhodospirillaceae bacterium]MYB15124.1 DUF1330 domain-containing protein [Rhodospirillaceae bacterium]MYI51075.1 DUF1330 domain-containing protein [Rhodospirillaceae bacterium]
MPKGYWVSCYREVKDPEALAAYAELAGPAVAQHGGRMLARGGQVTAYEAGLANRTVVIEFDSYDQALAARESDEYAAALERLEGAVVRDFRVVEGV